MARSTTGESVLSRAVRILEAFDSESPALTVPELARRGGLPLATASRLTNELIRHAWLRRDAHKRARIGVRLWEVWRAWPGSINEEATSIAAPVRTAGNRVVAALSVVVAKDDAATPSVPAVQATARGISRMLGASVEYPT